MLWTVLGVSLFSFAATGATLGAAMGLTGFIILHFFAGGSTNVGMYAVWDLMNNFTFSAVPMFILLGDVLVAGGLSGRIYTAIAPLFQRVPGQLLHSNIAVSTVFGAVSGSSAATSAAVGAVAFPELSKRGYYLPSVCASLAAGGTLGLLIPPSLSLLIYGAWQEVSIGKLFLAGILPGLLMAALFMLYIFIDSFIRPHHLPPRGEKMPFGQIAPRPARRLARRHSHRQRARHHLSRHRHGHRVRRASAPPPPSSWVSSSASSRPRSSSRPPSTRRSASACSPSS